MSARRPAGGVGSNQYQTVGASRARPPAGRVDQFAAGRPGCPRGNVRHRSCGCRPRLADLTVVPPAALPKSKLSAWLFHQDATAAHDLYVAGASFDHPRAVLATALTWNAPASAVCDPAVARAINAHEHGSPEWTAAVRAGIDEWIDGRARAAGLDPADPYLGLGPDAYQRLALLCAGEAVVSSSAADELYEEALDRAEADGVDTDERVHPWDDAPIADSVYGRSDLGHLWEVVGRGDRDRLVRFCRDGIVPVSELP